MENKRVKDSAGQERPIKLGSKLCATFAFHVLWVGCVGLRAPGEERKGRPVNRNRDVWVIRLETDFWQTWS